MIHIFGLCMLHYFLAHSCTCMQEKKNTSFIWYILKNCIPTISALSAVTNLKFLELSTYSV